MIIAVSLLFCVNAIAGIVIEEYNAKLNKTSGVITKIQGNKLTLRTDQGKFITFGVIGETHEDKDKIRRFKIGDRFIIDDGKIRQILAPQTQPLQPHQVFPK
jgi:hypothetical protein